MAMATSVLDDGRCHDYTGPSCKGAESKIHDALVPCYAAALWFGGIKQCCSLSISLSQIKSNMALIWVGKPQPSIKLNRLIRYKIDILDRQIYNIIKCDVNVWVTKMLSINVFKQHPCYKIALRNGTVLNC